MRKYWRQILIAFVAFSLYTNTLAHHYALDDKALITHNKLVKEGFNGVPDLFSTVLLAGSEIPVNDISGYRPLAPVTFAIEAGLWGLLPSMSHLINVLLYTLTSWLIFLFLRQLLKPIHKQADQIAFLISLLFVTQPLHTEVVANIKSRDAILAMLFMILCFQMVIKWCQSNFKSISLLLFACLSFFLSLLSKETSVSSSLIILLLISYQREKSIIKSLPHFTPFILVMSVFLLIYFSISGNNTDLQWHLFDNAFTADRSPQELWGTKLLVLFNYLKLLVVPHPLLHDYSYRQIPFVGMNDFRAITSLLLYISAIGFSIYAWIFRTIQRDQLQIMAFAIVYFLAALALVSNTFFLIGATMAERFLYEPSLAFYLFLILLCTYLIKKANKSLNIKLMTFAVSLVSILFSLKTISRNTVWENDFTLLTTDAKVATQSAKVQHNAGKEWLFRAKQLTTSTQRQNAYQNAVSHLNQAISIYPLPVIYYDLSNAHKQAGKIEIAITTLEQSAQIFPNSEENLTQLGVLYGMQQDLDRAQFWFKQTLTLNPNSIDALNYMGKSIGMRGEPNKAIPYFEKVLKIQPSNKEAMRNLIVSHHQLGNQEQAKAYERLLKK